MDFLSLSTGVLSRRYATHWHGLLSSPQISIYGELWVLIGSSGCIYATIFPISMAGQAICLSMKIVAPSSVRRGDAVSSSARWNGYFHHQFDEGAFVAVISTEKSVCLRHYSDEAASVAIGLVKKRRCAIVNIIEEVRSPLFRQKVSVVVISTADHLSTLSSAM